MEQMKSKLNISLNLLSVNAPVKKQKLSHQILKIQLYAIFRQISIRIQNLKEKKEKRDDVTF